jgi:hypothetical protein
MRLTSKPHFTLGLVILFLSSCGGGGGGGSSNSTVTGTAATGAAISGGAVTAVCSGGVGSAQTATDGTFTLTISAGGTTPCLLKVVSGSTTLYSAAYSGQAIANITPITNMIVANALSEDPAVSFSSAASGGVPATLTAANINSAVLVVKAALTSAGVSLPDNIDPLSSSFTAANGSKSGDSLDLAIDAAMSAFTAAGVTVNQVSLALKTANVTTAATKIQTAAPSGTTISYTGLTSATTCNGSCISLSAPSDYSN